MDFEQIKNAMGDLDENALMPLMNDVMSQGGDASQALEALRAGMEKVGRLFEDGEYFVGDLIYAGEIMTDAVEIIKPALAKEASGAGGKVLICTVRDDIHDIGKNIVKTLLEAGGFEVTDLGTDASPDEIVNTCRENGINIVALSGVLTLALDSMKDTVKAFEDVGLRNDVKIIIGGAPVNEEAFKTVGADAWSSSPQKTVEICRSWI